MPNLTALIPIPLIIALAELLKLLGLPKDWVKPAVFMMGVIFAGLGFWRADWMEIIVAVLVYALTAAGLYDFTIQPIKRAFTDDSNPSATPST